MIYIDVSAAAHSRAGLGRYSEQLARALADELPDKFSLFYNGRRSGRLPSSLQNLPVRNVLPGYKPWRMLVWLAHLAGISFNKWTPEAKLFHSTEHLLMPLRSVPTVLTVHDLIFKLFPAYHKPLNKWYLNHALPLYCRRASRIIAVSDATKRDIVSHYEINPDKIEVVPEAAASIFKPPTQENIIRIRRKYDLPAHYLIHLGTVEPRKNLNRLLDSLLLVRAEIPELNLVLAGSRGWLEDDFFARIKREGHNRFVHHLGWVSDADLPSVIAAADLAVQPSLYEGFGLPLLEHMACGQVVAASNSGSHPEVGGDAAAYFNPLNEEEMAAVIIRLLKDQKEYDSRRQLGAAQASRFSWKRTARDTLAVYNDLLKSAT